MKKVSKFTEIKDAILSDVDESQKWIQDRRDICKTCPYNSLNSESKSLLGKVKDIGSELGHCTACGCFIKFKTASDISECGLSEIGEEPLWHPIAVNTESSLDLDVKLLDEDIRIDINKTGRWFTLDITKPIGQERKIKFLIKNKDISVTKITSSCGCTSESSRKVKDGWEVSIKYVPQSYIQSNEQITKSFVVYYRTPNNLEKSSTFQFKGKKA